MDNDLPKDSFFRIDKEYGNIQRTHDLTSKIIALSQTDETQINNDASISNNGSNIIDAQISESTCEFCYKICKSVGGKKNHLKSCKEKVKYAKQRIGTTTSNSTDKTEDIPLQADISTRQQHIWGDLTVDEIFQIILASYEESSRWKRNLFLLPSGSAGKLFIDECTKLVNAWNNNSPLKAIAIKALMLFPSMMLQKPSKNSKSKEHTECLQRRLKLWREGDFDSLVREIRSIQSKLKYQDIPTTTEAIAKKFNNFMMIGNVKAALKLLSENNNAGILPLTPETLNLLDEKHPQAEAKQDDMMLEGPEIFIGEFEYNNIDGDLIQKSALHTKGAAGPSNLDADGWRRILTSNMYG